MTERPINVGDIVTALGFVPVSATTVAMQLAAAMAQLPQSTDPVADNIPHGSAFMNGMFLCFYP